MTNRRLSPQASAYISAVIALGSLAGASLLFRTDVLAWNWLAIALFGALGIAASAFSLTYRSHLPSGITHQIGTSFAYALFLLVDPGAVCIVLLVMNAADWAMNRRRPLTAVFNMAQLTLALAAAVVVRGWIRPGFNVLDGVDPRTIIAAAAALVTFSLVNEMLTLAVINLANRRPWFSFETTKLSGLLNESLCVVSGLGMAVLWWVSPWLSVLGIAPIWLMALLLLALSRREQALATRETELRSLQDLGLEIGSELHAERLWRAVVRIAVDALQASGAMLAVLDSSREGLRVRASRGIRPAPPARLPLSRFADGFFETGAIRLVEDFPAHRDVYPELHFLDATGILCAPLEILGRREGLLVICHGERRRPFDVEDIRRLETLVRFVNVALSNSQLVADIRQMQEQLIQSEKMSALGRLVSGVSHELNNPLTSILGFTELLMRREPDPDRLDKLGKVHSQSMRAMKIVQNLLTFSRKHTSEKKLTDVNQVLDQALELREHELGVRNVEVVRRLAPELPPVLVDPHQFQQVFLNLITNAEQALREQAGPTRIVVETTVTDDWIRVSVADNGPGIPREHLEQVFLPFFTTKQPGVGTGLGLSICYGIVKEHGGRIHVDSHAGEGATFVVEIPIAPPKTARRPAAEAAQSPEAAFEGGHLLVVDDEETIAELVTSYLEPRGWSVSTAHDGAEALEMLEQAEYDVVLVDLLMPGMDGRAFYERLRASRPDLARRVVFATAAAGDEETRFLEETAAPVLTKPYDLETLRETVARVAEEPPQVH